MRKLIVLLSFIAVLAPASVFASIYGILAGKVVDTDGKGIIGATVLVEGTTRGTNVRARDGSFTVSNIQAGSYTVRVRAVGKSEYRMTVRISADQTTNISVVLKDDAVQMDTVVVIGTNPGDGKVDVNHIGSVTTMSSEEITRQTGADLASVIGLSAGVSSGSGGFAIRGSRSEETQIRVDGLSVGNQFTGGYGSGGSSYFPMVSTYATEEVQVITGNFAAEYGEAQGGVVNTVVKQGRTDRYEGHIYWQTDVGALYGSQADGVEIRKVDNEYRIFNSGDGLDLLSSDYFDLDFGFGGPLKFINDRTTFYITGNYRNSDYSAGYDIRDPWGNSRVHLPNDQFWRKNLQARLRFGITNDISLVLGGQYGISNSENASTAWMYSNEVGTPYLDADGNVSPYGTPTENGILQRIAKNSVTNKFVTNIMARLNHTLSDRSFYEITVSNTSNNDETGRRVGANSPNFLTGFEIMEAVDQWIVDGSTWKPAIDNAGKITGDKIIDWASPVTYTGLSKDGYCNSTWTGINPLTGYYEGNLYSQSTMNPWGITGRAYSGGASGFDFRYGSYWQVDGNYNLFNVKTGEFTHNFKTGFEANFSTLHRHYNSNPSNGNPVYDIYTDKWGGNIYADSLKEYNKTSKPMTQTKIGAYIQDQITYKGIVFNPGLRLDILDPQSKYRVVDPVKPQFIPISSDTGFADASIKYQISPRISINYPITEMSYVAISYGLFFQSPMQQYMYDRFNAESISGTVAYLGDPNMDAQQTNQYQVSYKNQLSDEFALGVTVYYKDVYNQLGVQQVLTAPDAYFQYAVCEYGTSKGLEIELNKFMANNFAFNLNYALAFNNTTSSGVTSNAGVIEDPYSKKLTFPLAPYPASSDIRHQVKGSLTFQWFRNEGPTIGNLKVLQNTMLTLSPYWRTGSPYTRTSISGQALSEINAYRAPNYWSVDAKVEKAFFLRDWFGESFGNTRFAVFANIYNIFNLRGPISFYTTTGDPDDDGSSLNNVKIGNFLYTPYYETANYANASSFAVDQYDIYGNRLYSRDADFDGNGIVTQEEKYQSYLNYVEMGISARSCYQTPIRVAVGVLLTF